MEAAEIGLVNHVVQPDQVLNRALELAEQIVLQPLEALKAIKKGVRESFTLSHEENLKLTLQMSETIFKTEDCEEGVKAFFEKRKPSFKGV